MLFYHATVLSDHDAVLLSHLLQDVESELIEVFVTSELRKVPPLWSFFLVPYAFGGGYLQEGSQIESYSDVQLPHISQRLLLCKE